MKVENCVPICVEPLVNGNGGITMIEKATHSMQSVCGGLASGVRNELDP